MARLLAAVLLTTTAGEAALLPQWANGGTRAGPLSRGQAVALALAQGPDLAEALPLIAQAKAAVRGAGEWPNPNLGFSIGPDDPTIYGTIDQRFPVFGQRGTAVRAAQAEALVSALEYQARVLQVRVGVQRAYTALALAQAELGLAGEAAGLERDVAQRTRAKANDGLAPELDAQLAELAAARAQQTVRDWEARVVQARLALVQLCGLPLATPLATGESLGLPPLPAVTAEHPKLQAAELDTAAAAARVDRERAAARPTPTLSLQLERLPPPLDRSAGASLGVRGGITVDLPVLSQNGGAVARERAGQTLADAHLRAVRTRLASGRESARARFEAAVARARFNREQAVPAAQHVTDLARSAYDLGRTPLIALLQVLSDLNRSRAASIEAMAEAWDAREDLEEVTGAMP